VKNNSTVSSDYYPAYQRLFEYCIQRATRYARWSVVRFIVPAIFLNCSSAIGSPYIERKPGFDCKKASNTVEHQICRNRELSSLDGQVSAAYDSLKNHELINKSIIAEQRAWLKMRNACTSSECIINLYNKRLEELRIHAGGYWMTHWPSIEQYKVCTAILSQLNRYKYPDPSLALNACGWNAAIQTPNLNLPNWQNLDIEQHLQLLRKLLDYSDAGPDSFFGRTPHRGAYPNDPKARKEFQDQKFADFIKYGGKMQYAKLKVITYYTPMSPNLMPTLAPETQDIVRLVTPRWQGIEEPQPESTLCPEVPSSNEKDRIFFVESDLSGPLQELTQTDYGALIGSIFEYEGKYYIIGGDDSLLISTDTGVGLHAICELHDFRFPN
jgi:uncharacterized protein